MARAFPPTGGQKLTIDVKASFGLNDPQHHFAVCARPSRSRRTAFFRILGAPATFAGTSNSGGLASITDISPEAFLHGDIVYSADEQPARTIMHL